MGPCSQPEKDESSSLDQAERTDKFLRGSKHGGCRQVRRGPRAGAVGSYHYPGRPRPTVNWSSLEVQHHSPLLPLGAICLQLSLRDPLLWVISGSVREAW